MAEVYETGRATESKTMAAWDQAVNTNYKKCKKVKLSL
jgi:hypothetical protein